MESVPTARVEVIKLAEPPLKVPVPNTVVPCLNVTVSPSGGAPEPEVTAEVKVTVCPEVDGFGEDESVVVVATFFTTCFTVFDVLGRKFKSPPYAALTDVVPTSRVEVEKLAEAPPNVPVPSTVVPFSKETVSPSGGAGVTAAVKVTDCP
jgi:hypothetical protein